MFVHFYFDILTFFVRRDTGGSIAVILFSQDDFWLVTREKIEDKDCKTVVFI